MDKHQLWLTNINYYETWRLMVEGSDSSEIHEFDGLLITDCGIPFAFFNVAFVQRPLKRAEESIDRALMHFAERNLPALICFPPGVDDDAEAIMVSRAYEFAKPHPGMSLYPIPQPYDAPDNLEIMAVKDDRELERFQSTAEAGFGMPFSLPQRLLSTRFRDHPNVWMFLGYVDEKPVCTSILAASGPIAGVYWVSTLPDYRHRGYGTAMSWHAVKMGQELGCKIATLQASAMGRPVYEQMGFRVTMDFRRYQVNPEA